MRKQLSRHFIEFLAPAFLPGQPHEQMGQFRRCEVGMMQGRNRSQLHDVAANDPGLAATRSRMKCVSFQTRPPGRGARRLRHRRVKRIDIEAQIDILWKVFRQRFFRQAHPWREKGNHSGLHCKFCGLRFPLEISRTANCARGQPAVEHHGAPHDAGVGKMNRPGTDCAKSAWALKLHYSKITPRSLEGAQGAKRGRMLAAKQKRERRRLFRASSTIILNARKNLPRGTRAINWRIGINARAAGFKIIVDCFKLCEARRAKSPPGLAARPAPQETRCAQEARE